MERIIKNDAEVLVGGAARVSQRLGKDTGNLGMAAGILAGQGGAVLLTSLAPSEPMDSLVSLAWAGLGSLCIVLLLAVRGVQGIGALTINYYSYCV
jgi:hypothetical protein